MKGLVLKSTGSWYNVLGEDGRHYPSRAKGKLRLEDYKETNPIAVGDHVEIEIEGSEGIVTTILPRTNHILRSSVKRTGHSSVLAANVDQVLLIATLKQPRTSAGFIDRFFVSAESFRIPQLLILNKTDLLSPEELEEHNERRILYQKLSVTVIPMAATVDDLTGLRKLLDNKTTLMAGHSGVGKSTLLNRLAPGTGQAVGAISDFSNKGVHTTTFAEMFRFSANTFVIDTPGVKEWGLADMEPQEISDYFPEMRDRRLDCKFGSRCLHLTEPRCAIIEAVNLGEIARSRYESYVSIVEGRDNRK